MLLMGNGSVKLRDIWKVPYEITQPCETFSSVHIFIYQNVSDKVPQVLRYISICLSPFLMIGLRIHQLVSAQKIQLLALDTFSIRYSLHQYHEVSHFLWSKTTKIQTEDMKLKVIFDKVHIIYEKESWKYCSICYFYLYWSLVTKL